MFLYVVQFQPLVVLSELIISDLEFLQNSVEAVEVSGQSRDASRATGNLSFAKIQRGRGVLE